MRALELKGSGNNEAAFSDVLSTAYYSHELAIAKELGIESANSKNKYKN